MITVLSHLFIKDREHLEDGGVRRAYGMLCSIVGILLNVLLFAGKYLAGVLSGSIAVTADAFNNLSDAGSSFITLVGFRFSGMKADADHPFGHGRIEYISGFGVSVVIILMGVELLKTSVEKILHPEPVNAGLLPAAILVASICVKLYMAFYNRKIGKKIDSEAMKAAGMDSLSDSAATAAVLLSMGVGYFTGLQIDGWCGCLVACFVLYAGYGAARDTLNPLLGQPPSREYVEQIKEIVMSHPGILGIHDLVVHDYGPGRRMVSLHGEVSGNGDIFEIHDMIDRIEKELNQKMGCEAVIHMDPVEADNEVVTETKQELTALIAGSYPQVSIHDFRMVQGPTHTNLIFDAVVPYGYDKSDEDVKRGIENLVTEHWKNYFAVVQVEQSYV
ncbi:MAG TPA: cation transporter [Candidatus Copromonas faecavium]|uniref:Cation transporter n=1 Tax=Candidatus Copromonas faecavium (nom. illeg.) TaxID=2840740 RepID=A0A9D1D4T6_9FIRM|nr:cation transporter [Candidatus Copromonas faecavium]